MKPVPFDYARPADVASALTLAGSSGTAKFIAGGQSLGPMLNFRLVQPELLVDITAIDDLKRGKLTVAVSDKQGNVTRIERTLSIGSADQSSRQAKRATGQWPGRQ